LYALAKGVHEVDDFTFLAGGFFFWKRLVLYFGFDEFFKCGFVVVLEFFSGKLRGFTLDELFGESKLVFVDRDFFDVVEVGCRVAKFFRVTHDVSHHARKFVVSWSGDGDEVLAAAEGYLPERYLFCGLESFANDGESFSLSVALWRDEVRFLEERRGDFVFVDELLDCERVTRWDAEVLDLFGLDGDVLAFAILVPFDYVCVFDWAFFGCDLLMLDAFAGFATELMEANFTFCFGGREKFDAERDEGYLNLS